MNGSNETWIDLMSKDHGGSKRRSKAIWSSGNGGVTVTANTPRVKAKHDQPSRLHMNNGEPPGEGARPPHVATLMQEKQELSRKFRKERLKREQMEKEVESLRLSDKCNDNHSVIDLQEIIHEVTALRGALEEVTQERDTLRKLLADDKEIRDEENKMGSELKDKEIEIRGLKAQLKQLRRELNTMTQLVNVSLPQTNGFEGDDNGGGGSNHVTGGTRDIIEQLQTQLSERDENILKVERERDAFRERLGAVEAQRQLSMEQYQDEVETSVLAVTNQLEELLELNQQLQKELNNTQMEKEQLIICIDNGNTTREREKIHYQQEIANYECKLNQLTRELEQVKANSQQKVSSVVSKREQELQKQLDNVKKENENLSLELENSQLETSHQVTSLKQEKQSLLHKMGSLQAQYTKMKIDSKRMEEELVSVRKELSECQQVKASSEAHLITTRNELSNVHEQVGQLKMQLNELRDVSLPHSRQQVENLTQQLVQKSHQLQKADDEKRQLSNKVKKMENKIHELTLSQQNGASDLSTMTLDYKSIQSQLEVAQNINDQLEHKILTYENEINEWKKMALENQTRVDELSELIKLKDAEIKELENNGQTLKQALDKGNEHHSLEMTVAALRKENETLDVRLKAEIERNKVIAQTERRLSEENSKLRDVLNDSLSLNDKLQSSMDSSQVKMNSLKLSPVRPHSSHASPRSPSAADEISRLKQELSEAHQTCLQLDRQQEQDKTEMSKVQGSLQALVKIQDHLRRENKSLGETLLNLEEEKDKFRQEAKRLQHELIASQESLKRINSSIGAFVKYSTSQLEKMMEQDNRIVSLLTECQRSTGKDFEVPKKVFDVLSVLVMEKSSQVARLQMEMESLREKANKDDEGNREHIVQMQEKLSNMNEELSVMRKEMEKRNNELEERDKELAALQFTMIQEDSIRTKSEECLKKDLETQYQAKLAVLRGNLIDREDEVTSLEVTLTELKAQNEEVADNLTSAREELTEAKNELHTRRKLLATYEDVLKTETAFLDEETDTQSNAIAVLKDEIVQMKDDFEAVNEMEGFEKLKDFDEKIIKLRGEIEMLRAKKLVFDNYLDTHSAHQEDASIREREEIIQENSQLILENEELKQELIALSESTRHLQEQIEVMAIRLEDVEEESNQNREIEKKQLEENYHRQLENEMRDMKEELQKAQDDFRQYYGVFEEKIEIEKIKLEEVENERDSLRKELKTMRDQLAVMDGVNKKEIASLQERLNERDAVFADMQASLEHAMADRESHEIRLNESCPDDNTIRKIDKLKVKLKQQVKQSNNLRMKLGYTISELRLYKQLKKELDNQVTQLQHALTVSQCQYEQCLLKLNQAEKSDTSLLINKSH